MSGQPHRIRIAAGIADLVPAFLENRRRELDVIRAAAKARDHRRLWQLAHNLKGVAGSYGFDHLSAIGLALEQAAQASDDAVIDQQLQRLDQHLASIEIIPPEDTGSPT